VLDSNSNVYHVNLLEKMLVTLLAKLSNLVVEGGIWLNTQRPEWNDANNALVGQGLSMVTLYYLRRYLRFMQGLLADLSDSVSLSTEVSLWMDQTAESLAKLRPLLGRERISADQRYQTLVELGESASRYRQTVYQAAGFSGQVEQSADSIHGLLEDSLAAVDHSIRFNLNDDGLYHAYNLMKLQSSEVTVDHLYTMLEGQVAALSAGAVEPGHAVTMLEKLFASDLYRDDQQSFILYPDRKLPGFLQKNRIDEAELLKIPLAVHMLEVDDSIIMARDVDGNYRFNAELSSGAVLDKRLDSLQERYGVDEVEGSRDALRKLYETVFNHQAFTGRSGGMFGFEGLGSIYWHMVSKLLLVVQENYFSALDLQADESVIRDLGTLYYRVRQGIGFNKTPLEFGAFPTDPYSHTPAHTGARQPGMTGQVKEEVISRFGELGIRINNGVVSFQPRLLRKREFLDEPLPFRYLDLAGSWREIDVPSGALAFTWCQVPIVYQIKKGSQAGLSIFRDGGDEMCAAELSLNYEDAQHIFSRDGHIQKIMVTLDEAELFHE
ncbi:MAG: hypothetical protein HKN34_10355, partial [Gammaproteobacteria bacterium]|nr:hypothetical protein [Gammaproteobacteria bacterium]